MENLSFFDGWLRFLSLNVCGFVNKRTELQELFHEHEPHAIMIQEVYGGSTKEASDFGIQLRGYTVFNSPFDPSVAASHGVLVAIRKGIPCYEFAQTHYTVAVVVRSTDVPTLIMSTYTPLCKHKIERANQLQEEINVANSFLNRFPSGRILKAGDQNMKKKTLDRHLKGTPLRRLTLPDETSPGASVGTCRGYNGKPDKLIDFVCIGGVQDEDADVDIDVAFDNCSDRHRPLVGNFRIGTIQVTPSGVRSRPVRRFKNDLQKKKYLDSPAWDVFIAVYRNYYGVLDIDQNDSIQLPQFDNSNFDSPEILPTSDTSWEERIFNQQTSSADSTPAASPSPDTSWDERIFNTTDSSADPTPAASPSPDTSWEEKIFDTTASSADSTPAASPSTGELSSPESSPRGVDFSSPTPSAADNSLGPSAPTSLRRRWQTNFSDSDSDSSADKISADRVSTSPPPYSVRFDKEDPKIQFKMDKLGSSYRAASASALVDAGISGAASKTSLRSTHLSKKLKRAIMAKRLASQQVANAPLNKLVLEEAELRAAKALVKKTLKSDRNKLLRGMVEEMSNAFSNGDSRSAWKLINRLT
jgi:hypothetical protein